MFFSVCLRRHAHFLAEDGDEVSRIIKSAGAGNLKDQHIRLHQQRLCALHANRKQTAEDIAAAFLLKALGQPALGHADMLRDIRHGEILRIVMPDIAHGLLNQMAHRPGIAQTMHARSQICFDGVALNLKGGMLFDGEYIAGKEDALIDALEDFDAQRIEDIAISMRTKK